MRDTSLNPTKFSWGAGKLANPGFGGPKSKTCVYFFRHVKIATKLYSGNQIHPGSSMFTNWQGTAFSLWCSRQLLTVVLWERSALLLFIPPEMSPGKWQWKGVRTLFRLSHFCCVIIWNKAAFAVACQNPKANSNTCSLGQHFGKWFRDIWKLLPVPSALAAGFLIPDKCPSNTLGSLGT